MLVIFIFIAFESALIGASLKGAWLILFAPAFVCGLKAFETWRSLRAAMNARERELGADTSSRPPINIGSQATSAATRSHAEAHRPGLMPTSSPGAQEPDAADPVDQDTPASLIPSPAESNRDKARTRDGS
jgi:hypothetical protein